MRQGSGKSGIEHSLRLEKTKKEEFPEHLGKDASQELLPQICVVTRNKSVGKCDFDMVKFAQF
jgi:hypothetical protein